MTPFPVCNAPRRLRSVHGFNSAALTLLGCTLSLAAWGQADTPQPTSAPELRREIDGHNFIPSRFSLDPFVSTYVASETGFGYGTAPGKTYDLNGNPIGTVTYDVGAFAQFLDYQYGFTDWLAVRADAQLIVYSGLNTPGTAAVGTNAFGHIGVGTTVSFKVGERLRLGGSFDVTFGTSVFFNVLTAVRQSIDNGTIVSPVTNSTGYVLNPAFVGAWSIAKWVGLTFSSSYTYTYATATTGSLTSTASANVLTGNAVFDFDLSGVTSVPIGFLAGFQTAFSIDSTSFRQYRWESGVFYTGVKALNVGMDIIYSRAPVVGSLETFVSSIQMLLLIQYNFN